MYEVPGSDIISVDITKDCVTNGAQPTLVRELKVTNTPEEFTAEPVTRAAEAKSN